MVVEIFLERLFLRSNLGCRKFSELKSNQTLNIIYVVLDLETTLYTTGSKLETTLERLR